MVDPDRAAGRALAGHVPAHGAGRAGPPRAWRSGCRGCWRCSTAPPLVILSYIFSPVIWLLNKASNLTLWVVGLGQTSTSELAHSEEELRLIVAESVAGGHLSRNERMI